MNFCVNIQAKGPPKRLNSDTIEVNLSWSKIMLKCCPSFQIYYLRHIIFIYALKTGIEIS